MMSFGIGFGKITHIIIGFALAILVLAIVYSLESFAQDEEWYRKNDRGNRYEGRISIKVGRPPPIEFLSFLSFREQFDKNVTMKVRFSLTDDSPAIVYARELDELKHYWMESEQELEWDAGTWNQFTPWLTNTTIDIAKTPRERFQSLTEEFS